ncbi:MAG: pyruvate kinase [Bacteroidales bacterium]|jgi:pyruvate kinase|nr:pyruvate kinase [Bacteroidales bacterium]
MQNFIRRTKIVATIGPASSSADMIRKLIEAGMDVARLNFSHGKYEDHAQVIKYLRDISEELDKPVTIMQDLQGPKIRVGQLPGGKTEIKTGEFINLVPENEFNNKPYTIPIDYPYLAEEAKPGMQVLLADGLFELLVTAIDGNTVQCQVVEGGCLSSRKGVNFPNLNLRLPSLTDKDIRDLEFGLDQGVDWVSLSFVRSAEDVKVLKKMIVDKGYFKPVIAKIEKPQAIDHLEEIVDEVNGIMVARGDLGVEMFPEKVPMLQKRIIELCNRKGKTVITATQMLESMIHEPRPTRAEASDVANAIIDGTDAIMLSGETAMGDFPVKAVEMMARIAMDVEAKIKFKSYPPLIPSKVMALSQAIDRMEDVIKPRCIVVLTTSGRSAQSVAAMRPNSPVFALTTHPKVYHALNLIWGINPVLIDEHPDTFEEMVLLCEKTVVKKNLATSGDEIIILGGIPGHREGGTNFIKLHTIT